MATITANTGSNNWNTNGAWSGSVQPTAADDVTIPSGATVTIPASTTVQCRSYTVQSGGTLVQSASAAVLNVGDSTAGAGNVAINISSGATYTTSGSNGQVNLISTSTTQQTISSGGKTLPNVTINGAGSSYVLSDALTTTSLNVLAGTFNTSSSNYSLTLSNFASNGTATRTVSLNSSNVTCSSSGTAWNCISAGLTFSSNSATVTITGVSPAAVFAAINYNGMSFVHAGSSIATVSGAATFANYTITGSAGKLDGVTFANNITCTSTFTATSNSDINRLLIASSTRGTAITITAATAVLTNTVDFMDITGAGAATWTVAGTGATYLGDCGGNSGITFTTPATQTATGTASFSWSTHGWTSRVPLPQDDVVVNNAFIAGRTVTVDMPRLGKNVDFSGSTGSPILSVGSTAMEVYGSLTFSNNQSLSGTQTWTMAGRGSYTFTTAGLTYGGAVSVNAPGGTYTLQDNFASSRSGNGLALNSGTFVDNGKTLTFSGANGAFAMTGGTLTKTGTWNFGTTGAVTFWSITGGSITDTAGSINLTSTTASTRTFIGLGQSYKTLDYTVAGSTGTLSLSGTGYIDTLNFSDTSNARTLSLVGTGSYTIRNFNVQGTAGKLMTVNSGTAGTARFLTLVGPVTTVDYLSVQDINSLLPYKFYAGANSTDVSGNNKVIFTAPVTQPYVTWIGEDTTAAAVTTITTSFPYGHTATAGNLLYATLASTTNPTAVTTPTGWTLIDTISQGTAAYNYTFYKVADGTETGVTASWTSSTNVSLSIVEVAGFTGTPTLDVKDKNASSGSVTTLSTGAGVSNTQNPAYALASWSLSGSNGVVSYSNSYQEIRGLVYGTYLRQAGIPLASNSSQSSTYTWTTQRSATGQLAVFYGAASTKPQRMLTGMGL